MKTIKFVPAILAHNLKDFKQKLRQFEKFYNLIQIDVIDGKFAKDKNFYNINKIKGLRTRTNYEVHLMVKKPAVEVLMWVKFYKVKAIVIHYEGFVNIAELINTLKYVKINKKKVGLAINPKTRISVLKDIAKYLDYVVVMGVKPGKSGQKINSNIYQRIKKIKKDYPKLKIAVDGGVTIKNIKRLVISGADIIMGASIFLNNDKKQIKTKIYG